MLYLLLSFNDMVNTKGRFSKTHHRKDKFGSEVEPLQKLLTLTGVIYIVAGVLVNVPCFQ